MSSRKRLSICYAVLGHNLLSSAGPTRNVLYLAEALGQWADVTVVFHRILESIAPRGYNVIELAPGEDNAPKGVDDAAVRNMSLRQFLAYLGLVQRFIETQGQVYDIVLEKSWLLSGYVAALCQRHRLPAVVVENIVRMWNEPFWPPWQLVRYGRHRLIQALIGHYLRQAPWIIAETEELQVALAQRWGLPMARIEVIGLGVNQRLFRPIDQAQARQRLGIPLTGTVLLYTGVLDTTHNLAPVLEALRQVPEPSLQLHIVGDGVLRGFYEAQTQACRNRVVFHGRVPHSAIPHYIAAADLCLAPYEPTAFPNRQVAYSSLKIPEYMASARPVVSTPSGHVLKLIQHGVSGFLFPNDVPHWQEFLRACPSQERLRRMGMAAARLVPTPSWEDVAHAYLTLCHRAIDRSAQPQSMQVQLSS